ncbi:YbaB/EbfC family nucleoid-associated protein [Catenuloplanes atrovinosus]|uniref:DNA-binding protein YbaB n=1 Tax=Catenuloplanes atrovinosus TaxID=137266 RepID=A0AAE3YN54_9ACTN|nr:YbaB/EbfC family nucleoid-associated protein [Catenuloplanes atrovinosus]MDR7275567.1 DNA-binding protein YbaB [Catenuloplanes atrovinosus]
METETHYEMERLRAELDGTLHRVRENNARIAALQRELEQTRITGYAPNGEVVTLLTGAGEFTEIRIDPDVLRRYDAATVGTLVTAAVNDGLRRLTAANEAAFAPLLDGAA